MGDLRHSNTTYLVLQSTLPMNAPHRRVAQNVTCTDLGPPITLFCAVLKEFAVAFEG